MRYLTKEGHETVEKLSYICTLIILVGIDSKLLETLLKDDR